MHALETVISLWTWLASLCRAPRATNPNRRNLLYALGSLAFFRHLPKKRQAASFHCPRMTKDQWMALPPVYLKAYKLDLRKIIVHSSLLGDNDVPRRV